MHQLLRVAEFTAGLIIVLFTWGDVFGTVVLPLHSQFGLALGSRFRRLLHPLWTLMGGRTSEKRRHRLLSGFGGMLLLLTFISWMLLSLAGFTLMARGMSEAFGPPIRDMTDAFATVASAMVTLSTNDHTVNVGSAFLAFIVGLTGLGIVTLTLTYILQVQTGLTQRDSMVETLPSRAGAPPSGIVLLETMAKLGLVDKLAVLFHDWELWCAVVLDSHSRHPVLALFRSRNPENDWLTALGAVLDAAALANIGLKDGPQQSQFFLSMGARTCTSLCELFGVAEVPPCRLERAEVDRAVARLRAVGLELSEDSDLFDRLNDTRAAYAGHIQALSDRFCVRNPPWLGPADAEELVTSP